MKKFITIFIIIFCFGISILYLQYHMDSINKRKEVKNLNNQKKQVQKISSSLTDTSNDENTNTESESYNQEQIYFENVEILYKYLNVSQVENIKDKVQTYIHQNINKSILDCKLNTDTFSYTKNKISFELIIKGVKKLRVEIALDNKQVVGITIFHQL